MSVVFFFTVLRFHSISRDCVVSSGNGLAPRESLTDLPVTRVKQLEKKSKRHKMNPTILILLSLYFVIAYSDSSYVLSPSNTDGEQVGVVIIQGAQCTSIVFFDSAYFFLRNSHLFNKFQIHTPYYFTRTNSRLLLTTT